MRPSLVLCAAADDSSSPCARSWINAALAGNTAGVMYWQWGQTGLSIGTTHDESVAIDLALPNQTGPRPDSKPLVVVSLSTPRTPRSLRFSRRRRRRRTRRSEMDGASNCGVSLRLAADNKDGCRSRIRRFDSGERCTPRRTNARAMWRQFPHQAEAGLIGRRSSSVKTPFLQRSNLRRASSHLPPPVCAPARSTSPTSLRPSHPGISGLKRERDEASPQ